MYRITPMERVVIIITLFSVSNQFQTVRAQDYLSECDFNDAKPTCISEKFLVCLSSRCQCADVVNHIYDFSLDTCVIMVGRKCEVDEGTQKSVTNHPVELDPRQLDSESPSSRSSLPSSPTFPKCSNNAFCDSSTFTCRCKKGHFFNEDSGLCELSFGKSCQPEDRNSFLNQTGNRDPPSSILTLQLAYTASTTYIGCDNSVGLICGFDGVCKCADNSVWKIDQGCVNLGNFYEGTNVKNTTKLMKTGNILNSSPNTNIHHIAFYNGEHEGLTPFQRLVNTYTNLLIEANNEYYLKNNGVETGIVGVQDKIVFSPDSSWGNLQHTSVSSTTPANKKNFVGDRDQFPHGQHINPIWGQLLLQQSSQQNAQIGNGNNLNNIMSPAINNDTVNLDDLIKLQQQAAQLQKLLIQQQQLQKVIEQLSTTENYFQNQFIQRPPKFPNPPVMLAPQNNYLGVGSTQQYEQTSSQRYPSYQQQIQQQFPQQNNQQWNSPLHTQQENYPQYHHQRQQPYFGWPFPIFRLFKNMFDPIRQSLFPNLADAVHTLPSPLHIAASAVNNVLPVFRTIDKQFSPVLQNIVELTKPRPRLSTLPHHFNRGVNNYYQQKHQQHQSFGNSITTGGNSGQLLFTQQPSSVGQLGGNLNDYRQGKSHIFNILSGIMQNNDNIIRN